MLIQKDSSTIGRKYFTLPTASHSQTFPVTIVFPLPPPKLTLTPLSHFWLLLRIIKVVIILLNIIHSLKNNFVGSDERRGLKMKLFFFHIHYLIIHFQRHFSLFCAQDANGKFSRPYFCVLMSFKFHWLQNEMHECCIVDRELENLSFSIEIPTNLASKWFP